MSASPRPDPDSPQNPLLLQDRSNASLAHLLAQSYAETEALRRELSAYKQRVIKAERLLDSIRNINKTADDAALDGHIFPPEPITRMLLEYEDRALKAERAREEADTRRRAIQDNWQHIESYLAMLESRFQDARSTFSRVLAEGPAHLSLATVPSYAPAVNQHPGFSGAFPSLPVHPGRRPRTPSLDYAGQPPAKRARGDSDDRTRRDRNVYPDPSQNYAPHPSNFDVREESRTRREPRLIRPPGHHRSRSRSISAGSSVDDFFHQATGDSNGTNGVHAEPHHRAQSGLPRRNVDDRRSLMHPHSTLPPQNTYPSLVRSHPDSPPYPAIRSVHDHHGSLPQAGPVQPCQTHVFAPVVTGAPPKKQKYTPGATPVGNVNNIGSLETPPAPAPPVAAFPPTNAEGQRICRQCGMPGRYRDGKCVEKWGPGPMGPGTVCDRCRKKMKRVERRGTLEQQVANANSLGSLASLHASRTASHSAIQPPPAPIPATERPLQRSDTVLTHQSQAPGSTSQLSFSRERPREVAPGRDGSVRPGMSSAHSGKNARTISPPPAIASLREDDEANAVRSRSSSRNGRPGSKQQMTIPGKRSPLAAGAAAGDGKDSSPATKMEGDGETDADAEAEVDADAEGDGDHEEYEIEDDEDPQPLRKKGRDIMSVREAVRDPDEELFEAVEAAEANSASSHTGPRRYRDDD